MPTPTGSFPFITPRTDEDARLFDYKSLLPSIGCRIAPKVSDQLIDMLSDETMIYRLPSTINYDDARYMGSTEIHAVKSTVVAASDLVAFEHITVEVENASQLLELAFAIRSRSGEVVYLSESDAVKLFNQALFNGETEHHITFQQIILAIIEHNHQVFRSTGIFPTPHTGAYSDALKAKIHDLSSSRPPSFVEDMMFTAYHAQKLLHHIGLPFLSRGDVITPASKREDLSVPELAGIDPLEEGRKLNPHFGALAFGGR